MQKIDDISEAARKCSITHTGYVGKIHRIHLSAFVCLFAVFETFDWDQLAKICS